MYQFEKGNLAKYRSIAKEGIYIPEKKNLGMYVYNCIYPKKIRLPSQTLYRVYSYIHDKVS